MNILLVKTSSMGDALHTLPALTDAITMIPNAKIDWVIEENFAEIPSWHPAVDRIIPIAVRRWKKSWFAKNTRIERAEFKRQLQLKEYDIIIDAQGLLKSAGLVARLARGKKHGFDKQSAREAIASYFYDVKHSVSKRLHAVERSRTLFAKSLGYAKPEQQGDYAIAAHFIKNRTLSSQEDKPYFVFLHSTTWDTKHWPEARWIELIKLLKPTGINIKLPWGTEKEQQRALRLAKEFDHVEVLPKLSLREVANILANAQGVVSVDTGLSHLSAALDVPNITLFGPTDPGLVGGYGKNQQIIKSPTVDMKDITAEQVLNLLAN